MGKRIRLYSAARRTHELIVPRIAALRQAVAGISERTTQLDWAFGYERTEQNATEPLLLMVLNDLLLAHVASFL